MSIVRVGLAETKNFSDGYDLIFGKKPEAEAQPKQDEQTEKKPASESPSQNK
jgi:hypothetical protein